MRASPELLPWSPRTPVPAKVLQHHSRPEVYCIFRSDSIRLYSEGTGRMISPAFPGTRACDSVRKGSGSEASVNGTGFLNGLLACRDAVNPAAAQSEFPRP